MKRTAGGLLPLYLFVVLASLLAYGTALCGTFVYDDLHSVRDNPAIRDFARLPELLWNPSAFSALDNRMYRPVLLISFAFDHALWSGNVLGFKLTNLVLHTVCACLVAALVRRFGVSRALAGFAGALFAVHPLLSEAVNMISARSELLMHAFVLLALHAHERARAGALRWSLVVALCTVLAAGAKEPGVLVPLLLAARELGEGGLTRGTMRARAVPIASALGAALGFLGIRKLVLGVATAAVPALTGTGDPFSGGSRGLLAQLATMALVVPKAIALTVAPVELSIDPDVTVQTSFADPFVLAGVLGTLGLVVWMWWRSPPLGRLGIALASIASLPWIVLPLNVMLAEHRLYGLVAGAVLVLVAAWQRLAPASPRLVRAGLGVLALFALHSASRSLAYRDERGLWSAVLAQRPDSVRALTALGIADLAKGDAHAAREHLQRAVGVYPRSWRSRRYLAMAELALPRSEARLGQALVHAEHLRQQSPNDPFVRLLCAECLSALGDATGDATWHRDAEREALSCLEIAPAKGLVYITAARARAKTGELDAALAHLDTALARGLTHASVQLARAELLASLGRAAEALAVVRGVIARDPFDRDAVTALARLEAASPRR